jgi:serine protease Do
MRGAGGGINSQIYSRSGGYQGVSFAIPIEVATRVQQQVAGKVEHAPGRGGAGSKPELYDSFKQKNRGRWWKKADQLKTGLQAGVIQRSTASPSSSGDLPALISLNAGRQQTGSVASRRACLDRQLVNANAKADPAVADKDKPGQVNLALGAAFWPMSSSKYCQRAVDPTQALLTPGGLRSGDACPSKAPVQKT